MDNLESPGPLVDQSVITMPYEYVARKYQMSFWKAAAQGYKRFCLVWHRRAGKEKTCWNYMLMKAFLTPGIYYYFFPHFSQGRKIIWDGMDKSGKRFLEHIPSRLLARNPNSTNMQITIKCAPDSKKRKGRTSTIQIIGCNNYDAIVGTNPTGCVFSEYSIQDPNAWQLIRPILAENNGWAIMNFTPRGQNHGKVLYDMAKDNPDWFCEKLTADDTHAISAEDIDAERKADMSEDYIQQEFYCSFTLGIEGSYYGWYLQKARNEKRVSKVGWSPSTCVNVAMDLGHGDATALVFYQQVGQEIHIIDYYEDQGKNFGHYAKVIQDKPYVYGRYYAPSDAASKQLATGLSVQEVAASLGLTLTIIPTVSLLVENGIETARSLFGDMWFDETKCSRLIKCLENYQKVRDEKNEVYKERPLHNWASHGCFVAGTMISTGGGSVPIESVRTGDKVHTPFGLSRVTATFSYTAKDLLKIRTDKSEIICTKNHKIFTERGLISADAVRYNDAIYDQPQNELWQKLYGSISGMENLGFRETFSLVNAEIPSFLMGTFLSGGRITIEDLKQLFTLIVTCIEPYGRSIMAQFPKSITYITKTEIEEIIQSLILNLSQRLITPSCTEVQKKEKSCLDTGLRKTDCLRKNGILLKKGLNGTGNMQEDTRLAGLLQSTENVDAVVGNSLLKAILHFFAQTPVSQNKDAVQRLMMNLEFALSVLKNLYAANTLKSKRVVEIVQLPQAKKLKVYDFTSHLNNCYYANGLLVSNSDGFRYMALAIKLYGNNERGIDDAEYEKMRNKYLPRMGG